jgi:hypothetical protein
MHRKWWPLQSAIAFIMTRDQSFAAEVALADGTDRCIKDDLEVRVTHRAIEERPITSVQEADAETAWRLLRNLIADERIKARGTAIDCHLHCTQLVPTERVPGVLPPDAVEHLVLWDSPSGETWLAPGGRMCLNGQGRYWKRVMVNSPELLAALDEDTTNVADATSMQVSVTTAERSIAQSKSPCAPEMWEAASQKFPGGIPPEFGPTKL